MPLPRGDGLAASEVDELARKAVADRAPDVLLDQSVREWLDRRALVVRAGDPRRERRRERGERLRLGELGLPVADPDLDRRKREVWPHAPPQLRVLGDRARVVEEPHEALVLGPRAERVRDSAAREEAREDLRARRVEPGVHVLDERRARREREQLGEEVPQSGDDRDRAVGPVDPDVDMEAERVVAPDDVAQELVVSPVVRRVDDALLLPVGPRVRARRTEQEPHRLDEPLELRSALRHGGRNIRERLLLAGANLHLGGDELAHEVLLERRPTRGRLHVFEAVREVERVRIEDRELLLDGHREVGRSLELSPRLRDQLVGGDTLLVAHRRTTVVEVLAGDARATPDGSTARRADPRPGSTCGR